MLTKKSDLISPQKNTNEQLILALAEEIFIDQPALSFFYRCGSLTSQHRDCSSVKEKLIWSKTLGLQYSVSVCSPANAFQRQGFCVSERHSPLFFFFPLQLRREKIDLENTLEQEQEALVNRLWKRMDKLEAEKRCGMIILCMYYYCTISVSRDNGHSESAPCGGGFKACLCPDLSFNTF